jgi:hypothetical protein
LLSEHRGRRRDASSRVAAHQARDRRASLRREEQAIIGSSAELTRRLYILPRLGSLPLAAIGRPGVARIHHELRDKLTSARRRRFPSAEELARPGERGSFGGRTLEPCGTFSGTQAATTKRQMLLFVGARCDPMSAVGAGPEGEAALRVV